MCVSIKGNAIGVQLLNARRTKVARACMQMRRHYPAKAIESQLLGANLDF
jgi:hypothetical protein